MGYRLGITVVLLAVSRCALSGHESTDEIERGEGFQWKTALVQSALFLGIQHAFRFATEPGSRSELKGPFFRDYGRAVRGLRGWGDGDPFLVNYVGHPFEGAIAGFIQVQNGPAYRRVEFGSPALYWRSRMRALGWAALPSTQFEIGPLSEASLGNAGLQPGTSGFCDLVTTPVAGVGVMVAEDALDRYVVKPLEHRVGSPMLRLVLRGTLNPNRSFANLVRGKAPWRRDSRGSVFEQ